MLIISINKMGKVDNMDAKCRNSGNLGSDKHKMSS